jgi:hypothetical protein
MSARERSAKTLLIVVSLGNKLTAPRADGPRAARAVELGVTMTKHVPERRLGHSKLREEGDESQDARAGGWTREQLVGMDTAFCEALRRALTQRPAAARDLGARERG